MVFQKSIIITLFFILGISNAALSQLTIDAEADFIAGIPYNEVRIPATGGTDFDLAKDLSVDTRLAGRIRFSYTINNRHVVSALVAPLTIRSSGQTGKDIVYSGREYSGSQELKGKYKFNSYRLTYRYMIVQNEKVNFGLGLTGKVREANIVLTQGNVSSDYPDLGFVPLVNFYVSYNPSDRLRFIVEGDALASRQGRAEDIFAGISYDISDRFAVKGGYRILEGGADVKSNYNFAWINYIPVGIIITL